MSARRELPRFQDIEGYVNYVWNQPGNNIAKLLTLRATVWMFADHTLGQIQMKKDAYLNSSFEGETIFVVDDLEFYVHAQSARWEFSMPGHNLIYDLKEECSELTGVHISKISLFLSGPKPVELIDEDTLDSSNIVTRSLIFMNIKS